MYFQSGQQKHSGKIVSKRKLNDEEELRGIVEKINQSTLDDIQLCPDTETFKLDNEVKVDVLPELVDVNFYNGDYAFLHFLKNIQTSRWKNLDEHLKDFGQGHVAFIGPAGSGKTTLLKVIAKKVLEEKVERLKEIKLVLFIQCENLHVEDKISSEDLLLQHLTAILSNHEKKMVMDYLKKNGHKCLLIFDSLDTIPFAVTDRDQMDIKAGESSTPGRIFWNILFGKNFHGCRIITSSREYAMRRHEKRLKKARIIALIGFSSRSLKKLMTGYMGEKEAQQTLDDIEKKAPSLFHMCSTPVYLEYILIGWKKKIMFRSRTMSGMMNELLHNLTRSEHCNEKNIEVVIKKLKGLSFKGVQENKVVFSNNDLKKFDVKPEEVNDLVISAPGITWKLLKGSACHFFSHRSIQETLAALYVAEMKLDDFKAFLQNGIHLLHFREVRKLLCGILLDQRLNQNLGITELKKKQDLLKSSFKDELRKNLEDGDQLELILCLNEGQDGMKEVVTSCVNEISLDGRIWGFLLPSDAHALASVINHRGHLKMLSLSHFLVQENSLNVLIDTVEPKTKISTLRLSQSRLLDVGLMSSLGQFIDKCDIESVDIHECDITSENLKLFKESLKNKSICKLNLSYCEKTDCTTKMNERNKEVEGEAICEYVPKSKIWKGIPDKHQQACERLIPPKIMHRQHFYLRGEWKPVERDILHSLFSLLPNISGELKLFGWKFDDNQRKLLQTELNKLNPTGLKVKLGTNDVMCATESSSDGQKRLICEDQGSRRGKLPPVENCSPDEIWNQLKNCQDQEEFLHLLKKYQSSSGLKVNEIHLAHHPLDEKKIKFMSSLIKMVKRLEELELRDCELDDEHLDLLQQNCEDSDCQISKVTVSATENIGKLSGKICEMVKRFQSGKLCLEEGNVTSECLRCLKESLGQTKISGVDLSYNQDMEDFTTLGEILTQCGTKELKLVNCDLTDQQMQSLQNSLPSNSIEDLNLSYNCTITEKGLAVLGRILKSDLVKRLNLTGCDLRDNDVSAIHQSLQTKKIEHLNMNYNSTLEVDGISAAGKMVKALEIEELGLSGCELKKEDIKHLRLSVGNSQLSTFDMSDNMSIGFGTGEVAEFVKQCSVKDLDMSDCMLNVKQIKDFTTSLGDYELTRLNVSDSGRTVDPGHIQAICCLIPHVKDELIVCFEHLSERCRQELENGLKRNKTGLVIVVSESEERCISHQDVQLTLDKKERDEIRLA